MGDYNPYTETDDTQFCHEIFSSLRDMPLSGEKLSLFSVTIFDFYS
jgi:hypothetical protein